MKNIAVSMHRHHSKKLLNVIIAILVLISIIVLFHSNYTIKNEKNKIIAYDEWYVTSGDTAWYIAKIFKYEGQDIREYIFELKRANPDIDITRLRPGMILNIPIYE